MPDQREHREPVHQLQQVAAGVERGGLEVLARCRHHAQALAGEPLVLREIARLEVLVGRAPAQRRVECEDARASSWSGAPLTKQRTTSRPVSSGIRWNVAISL